MKMSKMGGYFKKRMGKGLAIAVMANGCGYNSTADAVMVNAVTVNAVAVNPGGGEGAAAAPTAPAPPEPAPEPEAPAPEHILLATDQERDSCVGQIGGHTRFNIQVKTTDLTDPLHSFKYAMWNPEPECTFQKLARSLNRFRLEHHLGHPTLLTDMFLESAMHPSLSIPLGAADSGKASSQVESNLNSLRDIVVKGNGATYAPHWNLVIRENHGQGTCRPNPVFQRLMLMSPAPDVNNDVNNNNEENKVENQEVENKGRRGPREVLMNVMNLMNLNGGVGRTETRPNQQDPATSLYTAGAEICATNLEAMFIALELDCPPPRLLLDEQEQVQEVEDHNAHTPAAVFRRLENACARLTHSETLVRHHQNPRLNPGVLNPFSRNAENEWMMNGERIWDRVANENKSCSSVLVPAAAHITNRDLETCCSYIPPTTSNGQRLIVPNGSML